MAVEIRMPKYPECWSNCGSCASGDIFVLDVFVNPGDHIECEDNIISIETGKVALDIPTPWSGTVRPYTSRLATGRMKAPCSSRWSATRKECGDGACWRRRRKLQGRAADSTAAVGMSPADCLHLRRT